MSDIQFISDNPGHVQEKSKQKGYDVDVHHLLAVDENRRRLLGEVEQIRAERNTLADQLKQGNPGPEQIEHGKNLKSRLAELEQQLGPVEADYAALLKAVPNMPFDFVPVGAHEDENVVTKTVGEPPHFDFTPKHDFELGAE